MRWLNETRCKRKKKYDFTVLWKCTKLLFCTIFIAIVPIFLQIFIDSSPLFNSEVPFTLQKMLYETVCKNDFRYINVSILFILFIEHTLMEDKRKSEKIDILVFIWFFFAVIFWVLIIPMNLVANDYLFKLSLCALVSTIIVHSVYVGLKYTEITYIYVER